MTSKERMHLIVKGWLIGLLCLILTIHGQTSNQPCPHGWFHYKDGRSCYAKVEQPATWQGAREYCQSFGGDLVTIKDVEAEVIVSYLIGQEDQVLYWIGLTFDTVTKSYHWLDEAEDASSSDNYWFTTQTHYEDYYESTDGVDCVYLTPEMVGISLTCSSETHFLCQAPQFANFSQQSADFNGTCDPGWSLYENGQTCFLLSDYHYNWHDARSRCQEYGGDLLVFLDPGSLIFLNGQVNQRLESYWIGLHNLEENTTFQWLDNPAEAPFTYWREGEPGKSNREGCAYIHGEENLRWKTIPCRRNMAMACQKPASNPTNVYTTDVMYQPGRTQTSTGTVSTTPLPSRCPHEWHHDATSDTCYFLSQTRQNWYSARALCQVAEGDLAVIKNRETQTFLSGIMASQRGPYWIGLHDDHNEGDFYWLNETVKATYTNWSPGEPNNVDDEDCAFVTPRNFRWNDAKCMAELLSACEKPGADDVTESKTVSITGKCPTDFDYYKEEDVCYGIFDRKMSWYAARTFCGHYRGDLATIKSAKVQAHISSLLEMTGVNYWVGLHDAGLEGVFHWLDDIQKATYFEWAPNQPHNEKNNEDCVIIKATSASTKWSDEPCHHNHRFLCQTGAYIDGIIPSTQATIPTPNPSEPCLPGWTFYRKAQTCYSVFTLAATWHEARSYCRSLGSDLAVIKNTDAHMVINYLLASKRRNTWIGLHDQGHEGHFVWLDDPHLADYTFWKPYEPNNVGNEDCAFITANMGWQDGNCMAEMLFVCERAAVEIPTESTPTSGLCPDGWAYYPQDQICYGLSNDKLSWTEARNECRKYQNGDLAVFTDPQRLIFVTDHFSLEQINGYWIGLHKGNSGGYKWLGDDTGIYPYWWDIFNSKIYGYGKQCVHTSNYSPFRWSVDPCYITHGYVCQASPTTITTTTTTTTTTITTTTTTMPTPTRHPSASPSSSTSQDRNISQNLGDLRPGQVQHLGPDVVSNGAVVGIVIAVFLIVAVVVIAVYFFSKRQRSSRFNTLENPPDSFENVAYDNTSTVNLT